MKLHGNDRRDNLTCPYGCCGTGKCKTRYIKSAKGFTRAARKRTRRQGHVSVLGHMSFEDLYALVNEIDEARDDIPCPFCGSTEREPEVPKCCRHELNCSLEEHIPRTRD